MTFKTPDKWIRTKADEAAVNEGCYFSDKDASRILRFCDFVRVPKGPLAGKPFKPLEWQAEEFLMPLFGWRRADGRRRYRRGYIEIPKKQGKSLMFSLLSIYCTVADGEMAAETYSCASEREQAAIIFRDAAMMIESSPQLRKRLKITPSKKQFEDPKTYSFYKALSADAPSKEGINASTVLFDELHAQPNRKLWDTVRYAGSARANPLVPISITTAGYDRESICYEQHQYAKAILDGHNQSDTSFFPLIYAADEGDDWTDEKTWLKANPSLGKTMELEQFREDFKEAAEEPRKQNSFKRYRLNIWTEAETRWLDGDKWDSLKGNFPDLKGRTCYAGLDLSTNTDLTALALLFAHDDEYYLRLHYWVPEDNMRLRSDRDRVPYDHWVKEGWITATDGNCVDFDSIRKRINELGKDYHISEIAIDRWNATHLATQLSGDGFNVIGFGQGYGSMSAPAKKLEELILKSKLVHDGNPVTNWMARNVCIESDPTERIKPSKGKSTDRIDGIVALTMAVDRCCLAGESVYDERGILTL